MDGRDFLYTIFQLGDPQLARPIIERIFGIAILRYIDRAWSSDGRERIALCDLAVQDDAVVLAHAGNKTVIGGRYGTRFRSAFCVRTPVATDRIVDVRPVEVGANLPDPEIPSRIAHDECCLSRRREPDSEAFRDICHRAGLRSAEASEREPKRSRQHHPTC